MAASSAKNFYSQTSEKSGPGPKPDQIFWLELVNYAS